MTNAFDDLDDIQSEDVYWKHDEWVHGGKFHGPSAAPGLTSREYDEMLWEHYMEMEAERDKW